MALAQCSQGGFLLLALTDEQLLARWHKEKSPHGAGFPCPWGEAFANKALGNGLILREYLLVCQRLVLDVIQQVRPWSPLHRWARRFFNGCSRENPVLVLSTKAFNERTGIVIGLPMTLAAFNETNPFAVRYVGPKNEAGYVLTFPVKGSIQYLP